MLRAAARCATEPDIGMLCIGASAALLRPFASPREAVRCVTMRCAVDIGRLSTTPHSAPLSRALPDNAMDRDESLADVTRPAAVLDLRLLDSTTVSRVGSIGSGFPEPLSLARDAVLNAALLGIGPSCDEPFTRHWAAMLSAA